MVLLGMIMSLLAFCAASRAHMSLWYPPPLGGAREANPLTSNVDENFNFPLGCCDSKGSPTLPSPGDCRGHLNLLDTEEGNPQVTWESGKDAYFQLSEHTYTSGAPGSTHYGGSCQVGFSIDKGHTWKVAASYHGNCPHRDEHGLQTFHFTVPQGMPIGSAVFAWIWLNREHESFMNCASDRIGQSLGNDTLSHQHSSIHFTSRLRSTNRQKVDEVQLKTSDRHKRPTPIHSVANPKESHCDSQYRKRHSEHRYMHAADKLKTSPKGIKSLQHRVSQTCDWASAPRMETSYFTKDAKCAANAKFTNSGSDNFEISWSNTCGMVEGDGVYPIEDIKCN